MGEKTRINLQIALAGEADANRRYTAYGIKALHEGYPEIAQLFFEAAGAETVHAYSHLLALGAIGTTEENLRTAAEGETGEIEQMYPRMIAEAEAEGDQQAAESFRLALEREKHHQQMFRRALADFSRRRATQPSTNKQAGAGGGAALAAKGEAEADTAPVEEIWVDPRAAQRGTRELEDERERISQLAGIRELVFGSQDGLLSTTTLLAGIAATTSQRAVLLVAGAAATLAGALSMAVGSYLASRAQRQLYESELAREWREIREKPGEELAEMIAALIGRGMKRSDAIEVARRVVLHPRLMLDILGSLELGLTPESLGSPVRDSLVMGVAFAAGSLIPLLPFMVLAVNSALPVTMLLALATLFLIGVLKAKLSNREIIAGGLEVMLLGGAAGAIAYGVGRLVSSIFGVSI
jgi:VIT1/CCC1 family predicted Fe2+/Mn2+ transporter/rubrerythrin